MKIITAMLAIGVFCTGATTSSVVLALDIKPKVSVPSVNAPHPTTSQSTNQNASQTVINQTNPGNGSNPSSNNKTTYPDQGSEHPLGNLGKVPGN